MSTTFILPFSKLSKKDVKIAGGKGASLGEMTQAKIPVPQGFVVLSTSFEYFIEQTRLNQQINKLLNQVTTSNIKSVELASEKIRELILNEKIPIKIAKEIIKSFEKLEAQFVAVRSSATSEDSSSAAWAGQLESYLNTTKRGLLNNVKRCWASLFTPRAIFYRFEKKLEKTKISVAVVIQKMINSEVSGIAFSVHPVTQNKQQVLIESGFGLGETIVSGQITPDSFVINKKGLEIGEKQLNYKKKMLIRSSDGRNQLISLNETKGKSPSLNDSEVKRIAGLILQIENHYKFPVDVEWAKENNRFYIVQSRPITTIMKDEKEGKIKLSKTHTREHSLAYGFVWNESDFRLIEELWGHNIKNFLVLLTKTKKLEGWYDLNELDDIYTWVTNQTNKNKHFFNLVKKRFFQYLNPMLPYLEQIKTIENMNELRTYYNNWVHWWSPMDSFLLIPDFNAPKRIREEALKIRKKTEHYTAYLDKPFLDFIKRKYPQHNEIAHLLLPKEVFLLEKRGLTRKEIKNIKKRVNGCAIFRDKVVSIKNLEKELKKENLYFEKLESKNQGELKGMSAFSGKVVGKVKLILHEGSISKLKKGEILIADMTSPSFIPAIKKAGAIVTDEGGTTCHAAIAAREFKIPCIVGTEIATKILKNGQIIEVDANEGIIKILKRK